jgi:peptide/nickel transport system substrate-binding protein
MVTAARARFPGVLIMAGLFLALVVMWRGCLEEPATRRAGATPDSEPQARGGQVVASMRTEPRSFNRLTAGDQTTDLLATLMQSRLVRINRSTFELEPWLAERWESSQDGRTHTLHLRPGVVWSDGTAFTSADVLFSFRAVFDPSVKSVVASSLMVGGKPIEAVAPDEATVVVSYSTASGAGVRLLDMLPILPRHKLEPALANGTLATAWSAATAPTEIVGTGPFLLREYQPGQRVVLDRNPRYWRKAPDGTALPYLDRLVLEIVPDQNAELLRLQSGTTDLTHGELRSDDYIPVRRAEEAGALTMIELGVGPDADALWFCLKPEVKRADPRFRFVQTREFRQALSHAVDREAFALTVFLGEAVPIWGPVTPGNRLWFSPNVPRYPHDLARARALLQSIGLEDRDGNGVVEDTRGTEARFTVITQQGIGYYERGTTVVREQAALAGIALDIVPLEFSTMVSRMLACDYDAIYMRPLATDLDPAGNLDYWLSSGSSHLWNMEQEKPATDWEARIDALMREQASTLDAERRREVFDEVQKVFAENVPALYFAAPRLYYAHSRRLRGVVPSVMRPPVLWNADSISVADPP